MNSFWKRLFSRHLLFPFVLLILISFGHEATAAQFTISWKDASSNEDGFKLERKTGTTGTFVQIGITAANTTTYLDPNLPTGTTYCYRVRAYNTAGNSAYSNEACATTPTASPFTLSVTKTGTGSGTVSGTGINCGTDCSQTYTSATSVSLSATPSSGSTFSSWSGGGCSGVVSSCTLMMNTTTNVTATFTATAADTTPPTAPGGLTATVASSSQINLSWTAATDNRGVTGYLVERCQGRRCTNFTQIATPSGTSYNNTGLSAGTWYRYRVRARDAANNLGPYSSITRIYLPRR